MSSDPAHNRSNDCMLSHSYLKDYIVLHLLLDLANDNNMTIILHNDIYICSGRIFEIPSGVGAT